MSTAETLIYHEEPDCNPALTLVKEPANKIEKCRTLTSAHIEVIAIALNERTIPLEIVEDVEFEDQLLLRLAKFKLVHSLEDNGARNYARDTVELNLCSNDLAGENFVNQILKKYIFNKLSYGLIVEQSEQLGVKDTIWQAYLHDPRIPLTVLPEWGEAIQKEKNRRIEEAKEDIIAAGRDFYLATGVYPTEQYREKMYGTTIMPTKTIFKNIFGKESEYFINIDTSLEEYYETEKLRLVSHLEFLESTKQSTVSADLFEADGKPVPDIERCRRYARYLISSAYLKPESSHQQTEVEEKRIRLSKREYPSKSSKDFYRKILDNNLLTGIDAEQANQSTLSRGELQSYAASMNLTQYIEPEVEANHLRRLLKLKIEVDKKNIPR